MKQLTLSGVALADGIPSVPGRVVRLFRCKVCGVSLPVSKGVLMISGFFCDRHLPGRVWR